MNDQTEKNGRIQKVAQYAQRYLEESAERNEEPKGRLEYR